MVVVYLLLPAILLVCGGDAGWWQAWVFGALIFMAGVLGRYLAEKRHPGLMEERINSYGGAEEVAPWDKMLSPLMAFSVGFPPVIVAGLDHRFGWSAGMAGWLAVAGLLLVAAGYGLADWALVENSFFSGTVRIQKERGHAVCDTGPYRIVRHPGYTGNILAAFGLVPALGSVWTLIPAALVLVIALIRTAFEDRYLQQNLDGYRDYAGRVRYRLLPGVY